MSEPAIKRRYLSRRALVQAALGGGVVAWAGAGAWSHARGADRARLAVIMLQGGADGLSIAPPLRDGRYHELRGPLAIGSALRLDADFGLHPALANAAAMARAGQLRLAPAAASPTRSRSHGSEIEALLTGRGVARTPLDGWLNRAVTALSPRSPLTAVSLDAVAGEAVTGLTAFASWSPGAAPLSTALTDGLRRLYAGDAQLERLLTLDQRMQAEVAPLLDGLGGSALALRAGLAGRLLAQDDGPLAAFLTAEGYDTHQDQGADRGALADRLCDLDAGLGALRNGAGQAWSKTVVLVVTEFGRTARVNGARGTDHGVASASLVLGGALKRGGAIGDWPGLAAGALHEDRELAPGLDIRALFKGVLAEHWGLSRAVLEHDIFPASTGAPALRGLIG